MSIKHKIKNQMRPFSDTAIYDEKPTTVVKSPVIDVDGETNEETNHDEPIQDEQAPIDCETVMNMSESSQMAIYDALKAKFGNSEQETGADNSKM